MNNKNLKSRRIALCGMFSALSLTCMLMGSFLPFSAYLAPAISGIFILPVVIEYKLRTGVMMFFAVSLLSVFLTPNKEMVAVFIFLLGWYPIVKLQLDKIKSKPLMWVVKMVAFNISTALAYFFILVIFPVGEVIAEYESMSTVFIFILAAGANLTFIIYDRALNRLIGFYLFVWRKKIMGQV